MNSTFTSDEVASVEKLNVAFRLRRHDSTVRQVFIDMLRNPVRTLLNPRPSLHVLRDVDLRIREGDRLGILGINGSGKTTLCRCIAGVLQPTLGQVRTKGDCRAIFNTSVGIIPELTGRENAELLARLLYPRETGSALDALVSEALAFSELGEFLDVPYETYSQGMKGRLCLSVLTAKSSDLLILDEVYENTDQFFREKMKLRMDEVIRPAKAVLFVSHSNEIIQNTCNRAIVLHRNRIVYDGPVSKALFTYELLNAPSGEITLR